MKTIRNFVAIAACKMLVAIGKLIGKKGTSAPGSVAMKISPSLLKHLSEQITKEIILVCGTNGKTTTNNLIFSLLTDRGNTVICNNVGANMLPGVACAFISKASLFGKLRADYASIECDEASLRHIVKYITPDKIVITNLFRDQMDRYGEIDGTAKLLKEGIDKVPEATLVLNADDPFLMRFADGANVITYGISENVLSVDDSEENFCPICDSILTYEYKHYNQLGKFSCGRCGFSRPNPDYSATRVDTSSGLKFVLSYKGTQHKLNIGYRGFYNLYNILSSFAVFENVGYDIENAIETFNSYKPQLGRMEPFTVGGKSVILNLAKNPAGFNQAISTVCEDKRKKSVLIAVNDMPSDGTDVSWLWDVDTDILKDLGVENIAVSGERKYDVALRLKYSGFENIKIMDINKDTLSEFIALGSDVCYLLVNYTVLFDTQNILKGLGE